MRQSVAGIVDGERKSHLIEGGSSCSTKGACLFTYGIKKALPLLHAGPGCSFCAYYGQLLHSGETYPFANTGVCSNEVIFGGEKALKRGISASLDIHQPEVIVVIPGCQVSTIGDDIEGVIADIQAPVPVLSSETSGYDGDLYTGFVKTGLSFLKHFCKNRPVQRGLVNVIGFPAHIDIYWKGNIEEIKRLINILGLRINCIFPGEATTEQIVNMPAAELNLVVDEQLGLEMAEYLKAQYGTSYIKPSYGSLIGTDNTMEFLNEIMQLCDVSQDSRKAIEHERDKALRMACQYFPLWTELIQFAFSTFAITAHASMALGLTRLLMGEIGLEPKVINFNPSFPGSVEKLTELIRTDGRGFQPLILENKDNHELIQSIGDDWPKIILGKGTALLKSEAFMNKAVAYMSISYPALDRLVIYNRPLMGFNGVPSLLDDILNRAAFFF